jgi:hypothetical protein
MVLCLTAVSFHLHSTPSDLLIRVETFISRCSNGAYSNSSRGGLKEDYQRAADAANALYPETETEMIRIPHTNPHDPHSACYLESDIVRSIPPHPARHTKAVMIKIQDCTTCP